jgi:hypothetical protein
MNQPLRLYSLVLLLLVSVVHGIAQTGATRQKEEKKYSIEIYRRYDKGKDETVTETGIMPINENSEGPILMGALDMNAFYTYRGTSPVLPQSVTIKIFSFHPPFQYRHDLTVVADGETFQLGEMQYRKRASNNSPDFSYGRGGPVDAASMRGFMGEMTITVPVETFKRIAGAKKVNFKIGTMERDLQNYHLEKLSGLVSAMAQ